MQDFSNDFLMQTELMYEEALFFFFLAGGRGAAMLRETVPLFSVTGQIAYYQ